MVEHNLAKVGVASSSLVSRSIFEDLDRIEVFSFVRFLNQNIIVFMTIELARWQSGHAAACKAVYAGSIPTLASSHTAGVVELVYTQDLKSCALKTACGFESHHQHHVTALELLLSC